jgi:MOSC domain-containing protein YiiM
MHRHPKGITVSYANQIMHHEKDNIEGLNKMLDIDELSESWRATFIERRDRVASKTRNR